MKRICLGAAIAGLLTMGVASASAASHHASTKASGVKTTKLSCKTTLALQVPSGATDVTAGATDGTEFGIVRCAKVGSGLQYQTFTTDDAGDVTGKFVQLFGTGELAGTYTLTPSSSDQGPPDANSFSAASWTGTLALKGSGHSKSVGKGTLVCSTQDAVHFACTEKLVVPVVTK